MAGPVDHIDGDPEAMKHARFQGPYLTNPQGDIGTMMSEGVIFVVKDRKAQAMLNKFIKEANEGFAAYTNTANAEGYNYLAADQASAVHVNNVFEKVYE